MVLSRGLCVDCYSVQDSLWILSDGRSFKIFIARLKLRFFISFCIQFLMIPFTLLDCYSVQDSLWILCLSLAYHVSLIKKKKKKAIKFLNIFFLQAILVSLAVGLSATPSEEELSLDFTNNEDEEYVDLPRAEKQETSSKSLRDRLRELLQEEVYEQNSKKKCMHVMTDRLNCGMCL